MLLCAANANMLARLPVIQRPPPVRHNEENPRLLEGGQWTSEAVRCSRANNGKLVVKKFYEWLEDNYPALIWGKGNWTLKARVALQRSHEKICPNCGTILPKKSKINTTVAKFCPKCNTPAPREWTLKAKYQRVPVAQEILFVEKSSRRDSGFMNATNHINTLGTDGFGVLLA
jgi:hypothetical protein